MTQQRSGGGEGLHSRDGSDIQVAKSLNIIEALLATDRALARTPATVGTA